MDVNVSHVGQATVIAVEGSIDALTADDFLQSMQGQLAGGNLLLVADLSGVDYASSAGLRAILVALRESRQGGGDLRLAAVQKGVYRVLELSGFNSILKIYDDVEAAVNSFDIGG
ncbi:MAG TPA: STAS domain-containing protein [Candidatus Binatia bacterium]|jgi:anti-anti-sigma factor|nr:STAS domain-containing protein [Candidatus Binatia bacterium]